MYIGGLIYRQIFCLTAHTICMACLKMLRHETILDNFVVWNKNVILCSIIAWDVHWKRNLYERYCYATLSRCISFPPKKTTLSRMSWHNNNNNNKDFYFPDFLMARNCGHVEPLQLPAVCDVRVSALATRMRCVKIRKLKWRLGGHLRPRQQAIINS